MNLQKEFIPYPEAVELKHLGLLKILSVIIKMTLNYQE